MDLTPNCAATSAALFRVFGDNRVKQPVTDDHSAPVSKCDVVTFGVFGSSGWGASGGLTFRQSLSDCRGFAKHHVAIHLHGVGPIHFAQGFQRFGHG